MTEKTETKEDVTGKGLELPMVFDEKTTQILSDMKVLAKTDSHERLILNAIRLYDWYLTTVVENKVELIAKAGGKYHKISFEDL